MAAMVAAWRHVTCIQGRVAGRPSRAHTSLQARGVADKAAFLHGVSPENQADVSEIVDKALRAETSWSVVASGFLTPPIAADSMRALESMADITALQWGGFGSAERCRIVMGREEVMLEAKGNFMFDAATHRDFLGACLGAGIDRKTLGDILIQGDRGAQILCTPEMASYLETALTQVRSVTVETRVIPLSELRVPAPKTQEIATVEASLRLDAIASAGFRMSRSKMSDLVRSGAVRVNWRETKKASVDVKAGDVISCTGKGRVEVGTVVTTAKGKFQVQLTRYV